MFKIAGIDHVVLRTTKLNEMKAFYCDILGCEIEREQPAFGLTQLRAGDSLIDLLVIKPVDKKDGRNMEHFCLRVQSFDYPVIQEYFAKHHIDIYRYGERYSSLGLGPSFYLHDPEGNEIELTALKA